ncbi:MAG: nucleotidyltransferase family protein [Microcoleaceae cyanobacterium]
MSCSHRTNIMTPEPTNDSYNPHSLSQMRTELAWEGKHDEYGNHCEGDIAGCVTPLQQVYQRLNTTSEQIASFCEKWRLTEFALFGSVLREDFRLNGEQPSDVDVLFTDEEDARKNLILQVRMKFELEDLLRRKVDMVSKTAILADPNYIRRQHILESARVIYNVATKAER